MRTIAATVAFLALTAAQTPERAPIEGYWKNPIGSAIIAIAPCGNALCGKVVWASERGKREASTSTSNVVGMTVLTGLKATGNRWTGKLFIPDDNGPRRGQAAADRQPAAQAHRLRARSVLPFADLDPHRRAVAADRLEADCVHMSAI
jgi:hypothetical protein